MTPSEFWEGDVYLVGSYRKAHRIKQKQKNEYMYVQGLYNFKAFSTALSNLHFDGKHHRVNDYIKEPFEFYLTDDEIEERENEKAEAERQKLVAYLTEFQKSWENKKKKGAENGSQN